MTRDTFARTAALVVLLSTASTGAYAQAPNQQTGAPDDASAAAEESGPGDIIVTARKRLETSFDTPVVLQAVGAAELERRSITNVEGLSRITPLLIIGENTGGIQGAPIAIRGIAGSDVNPLADQAVAFDIDGIQINHSTVARLGTFDLASAEILKGPQALFYGKNSPGGIISLRSADPTPDFQAQVSAGYEVNAKEVRLEGFAAGPLTENLGIRLAGYYSNIKGYIRNDALPAAGSVKSFNRSPRGSEFATRLTLKFDPSDTFDARFKLAYNKVNDLGASGQVQLIGCGAATPQLASANADCVADNRTSLIDPGPNFQAVFPTKKGGNIFSARDQVLTSLEMNFKPVENATLTSLTGYYRYHSNSLGNISGLDVQPIYLALPEQLTYSDFNQEFRLLTSFSGPVNIAAGATYQSSRADYLNNFHLTAAGAFRPINDAELYQRGEAYSFFGQMILRPTSTLELSAGGRYSKEDKRLRTFSFNVEQLSAKPAVSFDNFSPEVTVKWSATPDVNLFASYRSGFLSGGFNGNGAPSYTGRDLTFGQQTSRGFEAGLKARLFDRSLRVNLSVYDYDLRGLQVSATQGTTVIQTNAGKARTKGFELDGTWSTPVEGLQLRGALSYDKARYKTFTFACYKGQSIAQGCSAGLVNPANGAFSLQDLAGARIVRAPDWGAAAGFNYETEVSGLKLGLSGDANYSSGYFNNAFNAPLMWQRGYWLFDNSLRIGAPDDSWEFAVIGRNLGNKYYVARSAEQPFSGGLAGTAAANRQADVIGAVSRGREVMLRGTVRF
jgi:iron complex outermembrane receptor protein